MARDAKDWQPGYEHQTGLDLICLAILMISKEPITDISYSRLQIK